MTTCILSLGSNESPEKNIAYIRRRLSEEFPDIRFSRAIYTRPINMTSKNLFLNQTASFKTSLTAEEIRIILKQIEQECGRTNQEKQKEIIRADIDLIKYGPVILKPTDMSRPDIVSGIQELDKCCDGSENE